MNLAAYDIKYDDLQVLLQLIPVGSAAGTPGVLFTLNAADSKSKGAELEVSTAPTERWLLSGSVSTIDAKFKSFFVPPGFLLPSGASANSSARSCAIRRTSPGTCWRAIRIRWRGALR